MATNYTTLMERLHDNIQSALNSEPNPAIRDHLFINYASENRTVARVANPEIDRGGIPSVV